VSACASRQHARERHEIGRMIDIHADARQSHDCRFNPATPRRIEMRKEAVVAEPQRHRIRW